MDARAGAERFVQQRLGLCAVRQERRRRRSGRHRIGTTQATTLIVEECSGCGLSKWGWADNGYGGLGPLVYFATSGPQTIRIQGREDGIAIDEIILSSSTYLTMAPGAPKNDTTIVLEPGLAPVLPGDVVLNAAEAPLKVGAWRVTPDGTARGGARIEHPDAAAPKEDCVGCGVAGWGWQDEGFGAGVMGPDVYFAKTGVQRIRVQTREDGFSIDQIVLSPAAPSKSPGALKNDTILPR